METVTTIIQKGQKEQWKGSQGSQAKPTDKDLDEIDYLFGLLSLEYPFFMPKSDEDLLRKRNMWISLLKMYGRTERMKALKACLSHFKNKGGPSIGEFLELLKTNPAHTDYKALPLPEAKQSIVERELAKMKEILR
jgi:hypothetical protein